MNSDSDQAEEDSPLWEVFTQEKAGAPHEHAGSLHASDEERALLSARDVYSRRGDVVSIWVVRSDNVFASASADADEFFDPSDDKAYRHPQFYTIPRGVKNI